MNLYIAVRGEKAGQQWSNVWHKGQLLEITTSPGLISHCRNELIKGSWVYIHRTAKDYDRPAIIAKVKIDKIVQNRVLFSNWSPMLKEPPRRFRGGKCYYDKAV